MQTINKTGDKVNDNLQYVALTSGVMGIRPNSTRRTCLCPVCITPPQKKKGVLSQLPENANFLSAHRACIGLLKGPNATAAAPYSSDEEWLKELFRGCEMRPAHEWPQITPDEFRAIFRRQEKEGYTHVYQELEDVLTSWRPVLTRVGSPPTREARLSCALSGKQKKKIRLAARHLDGLPGESVFMTLTFKNERTCHSRAKRDLDTFLKRYKRHTGCVKFLWVAELQKRGTIHFHLILKSRVDMAWFQRSWKEITGQDVGQQDIRPIKGGSAIARYLSKYVTKGKDSGIAGRRYSMDGATSRAIRPKPLETYQSTYAEWHDKMSPLGCQIGQNVIYLTQ